MKLFRCLTGRARSGQTALVIVLALPVVVESLALVIDVGNLYFNKIRMQTATDSAVLAGGNYLPAYPTQAVTVAQDYAVTNGIKSSEIQSIEVTPDDKAVTMTVARHLPCYFCAVLGASIAYADTTASSPSPSGFGNVSTTATAEIEPINAVSGVVPIGVDYRTDLNFGNVVMLKQGQVGPGNWEPLALGGTGGSNFNYNVENGYSGTITVGDELQTEPGNLVGPTNQSMKYRINAWPAPRKAARK
jgi:Flp pilus assembly protein TadG